jgi:ubiquinone/menaquinone biosynthesis C-methylase UbiE
VATGAEVIGVDLSEELVAVARRRLPQVRFLASPAETLEGIDDASIDCVVGNAALHHFEVELALRAMRRVLRPGGVVCFAEPNMMNPQIFLRKNVPMLKRLVGDTPHETAFFRWHIDRALRRAGFVEVDVTPFEFLHPGTPAVLVQRVAALSEKLERLPVVREIAGSLLIFGRRAA